MFRNALTKATPRTLTRDPLFNLVDTFFDGGRNSRFTGPSLFEASNRDWSPAVDIHETADAFSITSDLPGLSKDDLDISVEDNVLTISGERSSETKSDEESGTWRRVERSFGSFSRSFSLPSSVDTSKVEATFENGVLELHVPKHETAQVRKITVS